MTDIDDDDEPTESSEKHVRSSSRDENRLPLELVDSTVAPDKHATMVTEFLVTSQLLTGPPRRNQRGFRCTYLCVERRSPPSQFLLPVASSPKQDQHVTSVPPCLCLYLFDPDDGRIPVAVNPIACVFFCHVSCPPPLWFGRGQCISDAARLTTSSESTSSLEN